MSGGAKMLRHLGMLLVLAASTAAMPMSPPASFFTSPAGSSSSAAAASPPLRRNNMSDWNTHYDDVAEGDHVAARSLLQSGSVFLTVRTQLINNMQVANSMR